MCIAKYSIQIVPLMWSNKVSGKKCLDGKCRFSLVWFIPRYSIIFPVAGVSPQITEITTQLYCAGAGRILSDCFSSFSCSCCSCPCSCSCSYPCSCFCSCTWLFWVKKKHQENHQYIGFLKEFTCSGYTLFVCIIFVDMDEQITSYQLNYTNQKEVVNTFFVRLGCKLSSV